MKKLLTVMMVILVAGITQAASVAWSTGALTDAVTGLALGNANGNYSAVISFYTDALGTTPVAGVTGNDDFVTNFGSALSGTAITFANSTTYYAKIVITSDDGNWKKESAIEGFAVPASPGNANINFGLGTGFLTGGTKLPVAWTAVPEPTSMALLALGVAAIGLRRKFRK